MRIVISIVLTLYLCKYAECNALLTRNGQNLDLYEGIKYKLFNKQTGDVLADNNNNTKNNNNYNNEFIFWNPSKNNAGENYYELILISSNRKKKFVVTIEKSPLEGYLILRDQRSGLASMYIMNI